MTATTPTTRRLAETLRTAGTTAALIGTSRTSKTIGTAGTSWPETPTVDASSGKTVTNGKTALTATAGGSGTGAPTGTAES